MENLLKRAYELFSIWVTNAKKKHPDLNYNIDDPSIFERDLEYALNKAIDALADEDKIEKRKIPGFDKGYICGFIEGNLNTLWYHEYIKKQTNGYKMYAAITVLDDFLKFDDLLKVKLSSLYTEYYKRLVNIENISSTINLEIPYKLNFLDLENSNNPILISLENIKIQMLQENFEEDVPDFLFNTNYYFSTEDIAQITT